MKAMSDTHQTTTVAQATADFPRHSGPAMLEHPDGSITIAWIRMTPNDDPEFPGNDDAPADIAAAVSYDGGRSWQGQRTLVELPEGDTSVYSPSLLRLRDGRILFRYERYHQFVKDQPRCISACVCISSNECASFSEPTLMFERSANFMGSSNNIRQLEDGRLIAPVMYAMGNVLQGDGEGLAPTDHIMAGCFYSDDGVRWMPCDNYVDLPLRGAMEPQIEPLSDGRLIMIMRTQLGSVFKSISEDRGVTWSKAQTTGMHAPESCPGMLRLPGSGDLVMVWNHSSYDPQFDHYGKRTPLTVAISQDDGQSWGHVYDIETDPEWEFTNPAAITTRDGRLLIAYEASKYKTLTPPGRLGRSRMHLKLTAIDIDRIYGVGT